MADSPGTPGDDRPEFAFDEGATRATRKPDEPGEAGEPGEPQKSNESTLSAAGKSDFKHGRFEPGQRLGSRYRIVGLLGKGGMGEVYRADDLDLGQSVALKFLPQQVAADVAWLGRFRNEVRTAREVTHPNVCRIYDIAEEDGHVFLSMEYIDGEDLAGVLRRLGRPSREKAIEIARQLCMGLAAAHEKGVLHRDLKPANIMIDGRGHVRITDFGIAGFVDELEQVESRAGTPAYMAPEQLARGKVSVRSDIYTLGLILHELFTGKCVFEATDVEELKRQHTSGSVSTPSSITEDIDPAVERVVMRCLEQEPEQRPQSVYQVLAALPGSDPLAAALAAGELPSPELVAHARDAGGLRPAVAVGLLVAMIASMAIVWFTRATTTVMPEQSPAVLSVVAEQIMREMGYGDLPRNSVSGYDVNLRLTESLRASPLSYEELSELDRPPRFFYWRRWADAVFIPINFHFPEAFAIDGPTRGRNDIWSSNTTGDVDAPLAATVALDSRGRLLRLRVTTPSSDAPPAPPPDTDWSAVFRLAGLDRSTATEVPPLKRPPVDCDDLVAWTIDGSGDDGDSITAQMGAVGGRPTYFEILGADEAMGKPEVLGSMVVAILWLLFDAIILVLAWRNLRASRGDRRNAFRCALAIGMLYLGMELLSVRLSESSGLGHADVLANGRAAGHVILHAFKVWLVYMAIEPYVRRLWPRMLVGLVRLFSGRLRDPAVGREVLIGLVTGCGIVAVVSMLVFLHGRAQTADAGRLPFWWTLRPLLSPGQFLANRAHFAAWSVVDGVSLAGFIVIARFVARHSLAATLLSILLFGAFGAQWLRDFAGTPIGLAAGYGLIFGTAMVLLYTRVGVLAVIVAVFVYRSWGPITASFDSWAGPYAVAALATLLALAAYGFWVSLAGQTVFRDMLEES